MSDSGSDTESRDTGSPDITRGRDTRSRDITRSRENGSHRSGSRDTGSRYSGNSSGRWGSGSQDNDTGSGDTGNSFRRSTSTDSGSRRSWEPGAAVLCVRHCEQLILFCTQCEECVCPHCLVGTSHRNHSLCPIPEACEQQRSQITNKVQQLLKSHERMRQNLESFPLSLQDMEEIIRRTQQSVREKYRVMWELLEADMRRTEGLIEAERERMEFLLRGQQVDSVAYSDSISAIVSSVEGLDNSSETQDIRRLQEIVSWRTRLEMFEGLQQNIGKQCRVDGGRLTTLERSVDELWRSMTRILPRMWQYSRNLNFDAETCHPQLCVMSDQRSVHCLPLPLSLLDKHQRFDVSYNVLARENFSSGKHYWEVRVSKTGNWRVGLAYASMARKGKGKETVLGENKHSWVLRRLDKEYHALHGSDSISLDLNHKDHGFERLGVFLHCEEGRLSFYNVDRSSHIHSFKAHFRAPLFPAFSLTSSRHTRNQEPIVLCHLISVRESEDCVIKEER